MILSHIKVGKEMLMFGDIKIEKKIFTAIKVLFFKKCRHWKSISI